MPLREEIERQGNWLFKYRSVMPVFGLILMILAYFHYKYLLDSYFVNVLWTLVCFAVSLLGQLVRILTTGFTPKRTSGRNTDKGQVADSVNTTGIYSLFRHPLYIGNFLMTLGPVMFFHQPWLVFVYILLFWFYYERIVFAEEEFLRGKFGQTYLDWANKTNILIPNFRNFVKPAMSFSIKTVIKREYQTLALLVFVFALQDFIGNVFVLKKLDASCFGIFWTGMFIAAMVMFIIVRIIRKTTKLLKVEDR